MFNFWELQKNSEFGLKLRQPQNCSHYHNDLMFLRYESITFSKNKNFRWSLMKIDLIIIFSEDFNIDTRTSFSRPRSTSLKLFRIFLVRSSITLRLNPEHDPITLMESKTRNLQTAGRNCRLQVLTFSNPVKKLKWIFLSFWELNFKFETPIITSVKKNWKQKIYLLRPRKKIRSLRNFPRKQ